MSASSTNNVAGSSGESYVDSFKKFAGNVSQTTHNTLNKANVWLKKISFAYYDNAEEIHSSLQLKNRTLGDIFEQAYKTAPFAAVLLALYSAVSLPALVICSGVIAGALTLTRVKVISEKAIEPLLKGAIVTSVIATALKIVSLLAAGAGIASLGGVLALGALVTLALYLILNSRKHSPPSIEVRSCIPPDHIFSPVEITEEDRKNAIASDA